MINNKFQCIRDVDLLPTSPISFSARASAESLILEVIMIRILNVVIDGQMQAINVEEETLISASSLFNKMDEDMNKGWTLSKEFVENPDITQRCQIVGDKLLSAIEDENDPMKTMMAGYILSRVPNIMTLYIDNTGEIFETQIELAPS